MSMMRLDLERDSGTPLFEQIASAFRERIMGGLLREGTALPTERDLAKRLGVNRSTVVKAYGELKADGFVEARVGSGTVVASVETKGGLAQGRLDPLEWDALFNPDAGSCGDLFSGMMSVNGRESVISFASGFPDPDLFPADVFADLERNLPDAHARFLPSPVEGFGPLRESVSELLHDRGIEVPSRNVMILSGSQQGLDFAARAFLSPGDIVLAEKFTFFGALEIFRAAGARVVGIPTDRDGMRTDLLESAIRRHNPRLIYTLPTFQNPTGITLSLERRHELLETASRFGVPVLEDDPYGELRYGGSALPPLKALDPCGCVIYLSSFSKVLFLGFRVGFVAAPVPVIERFSRLKQMTDLHVNTPAQILLDRFLREGHYGPHLDRVREAYRRKRDRLAEALSRYRPRTGWDWDLPDGGYYLWCSLPGLFPMRAFTARASENRVAFMPGQVFCADGTPRQNRIRLNFTHVPEADIAEGARRLARAAEKARENGSVETAFAEGQEPIV
jgi:DNA-binding transcriptional MocR family regulator